MDYIFPVSELLINLLTYKLTYSQKIIMVMLETVSAIPKSKENKILTDSDLFILVSLKYLTIQQDRV